MKQPTSRRGCVYRAKQSQRRKIAGTLGKIVKKRAVVGKYSGGSLQKRVPQFSKSSRKKR